MKREWQHPEISKEEAERIVFQRMNQIGGKIKEANRKLREYVSTAPDDMSGRNIFSPYQAQMTSLRRCFANFQIAMEKIEEGIWGICEECGEPIQAARLKIRPEAKTCIDCKNREEKKKLARNGGKRFLAT